MYTLLTSVSPLSLAQGQTYLTQLAGALEYVDCTSAER